MKQSIYTIVGLLGFASIVYFGGFEGFKDVTKLDYRWLLIAFAGTGLMTYVFSVRWGGIVNSLAGQRVLSKTDSYFYSLSALLAGSIIPHTASTTIGKAAALFKFENVSMRQSGASVLLDKLFDGFFMLMFFWPVFLIILNKITVLQAAMICLLEFSIVTFLIVFNYSLWILLFQKIVSGAFILLSVIPYVKKAIHRRGLHDSNKIQALKILERRTVLRAYFLTALGQILLAIRSWLAAMAIGLNIITPLDTFIAIGLVQASILISFTPGALGFADAAWFIALESSGIPKETIVVFLVAHRLIENIAILLFWFPLYLLKVWKMSSVR